MNVKQHIFLSFLFLLFSYCANSQLTKVQELEYQLSKSENYKDSINYLREITRATYGKDSKKYVRNVRLALSIANRVNDETLKTIFCTEYSKYHFLSGSKDSAFYYIILADEYSKNLTESKTKLNVQTHYADMLKRKGKYKEATTKYIKVIRLAEKTNSKEAIISAQLGIASLYQAQNQHKYSVEYIEKTIPLCYEIREGRKELCLAVCYTNLSIFLLKTGEVDSAAFYCQKAIDIKKTQNNLKGLITSYIQMSNITLEQKDTLSAIKNLENALSLSEKLNNKSNQFRSLIRLGNIYCSQKNKWNDLNIIINKLEAFLVVNLDPLDKTQYYALLVKYYDLNKDFEKSNLYLRKKYSLKDSMRDKENSDIIFQLETEYKTDKYQREKELAEAEAKVSKTKEKYALKQANQSFLISVFATIIGIVLVILLGLIYKRSKTIRSQQVDLKAAFFQLETSKQNELALSNLKTLRSQMNPHFIFNSLNSIQAMVLKNDVDNTYDYITIFSNLVRKALENSEKNYIKLNDEINFLKMYLNIEALRFKEGFRFKINNSVEENIEIPSMIIQPFLENAIQHGLLHKSGNKILEVDIYTENDSCVFKVIDNGIGRKESKEIKKRQKHSHTSFSLNATQQRLEILSSQLGGEFEYLMYDRIEGDEASGTIVIIKMPYKKPY